MKLYFSHDNRIAGGRILQPSLGDLVKSDEPMNHCAELLAVFGGSTRSRVDSGGARFLIMNADDWGLDRANTDRTLDCVLRGAVSSVSAMVFMEDSERSAAIARERGISTGLHLNLTTRFSAAGFVSKVREHQERVAKYLQCRRLAQALFHPGLMGSFKYVVEAQLEEFGRLYGAAPLRIDGHHHMHLCANVVLANLLPAGTVIRRNFSFRRGEKSFVNRIYRKAVDNRLSRRHYTTDYFFSLPPLDPFARLEWIFSLAGKFVVEVETHPVRPEEYCFLMSEKFLRLTTNVLFKVQPGVFDSRNQRNRHAF